MPIINESGLYSLILSSKLPTAKQFKRWVTSEILPTLRKTGGYTMMPKDYATALRALADEAEKNELLALENVQQKQQQWPVQGGPCGRLLARPPEAFAAPWGST